MSASVYRTESRMAGPTGLEPATFCVTGRRSNQLSYDPKIKNIKLHNYLVIVIILSVNDAIVNLLILTYFRSIINLRLCSWIR